MLGGQGGEQHQGQAGAGGGQGGLHCVATSQHQGLCLLPGHEEMQETLIHQVYHGSSSSRIDYSVLEAPLLA